MHTLLSDLVYLSKQSCEFQARYGITASSCMAMTSFRKVGYCDDLNDRFAGDFKDLAASFYHILGND